MVLPGADQGVEEGHRTCDEQPLSAVAKKVPAKLTGSSVGHNGAIDFNKLNRQKFGAIVDKLFKRQDYIESIHGILYSDAYPIQVTGSATKAIKWPATGVKTLKKTPMSWVGNFLFALYGQYGLTKEIIAAMMSRNEGGM